MAHTLVRTAFCGCSPGHSRPVQGKYLHCAGVSSLSYGSPAGESPIAGGDSTAALERELQASARSHDAAGLVSLDVRADTSPCDSPCCCAADKRRFACSMVVRWH